MTRPGPKPTPTHLRVLRGDRRDRINAAEPKPNAKTPRVPAHLNDDARRVWRRVTKTLAGMGLLYESDMDVIAAYCTAVATYEAATKLVDEMGLLVEGRRDGWVTNPAVRIQRDAAQQVRQLAAELGLTPSSRSRLSVETPEGDGEDSFLD